jgi:4-hydroxy-tetrahydrodipicolinate synthase
MKKFEGVITALATPFMEGKVDYLSLEKLVQFQLKNKIDGFVINGTTAESPTLTGGERTEIFKQVRRLVPKDFPLIMGTGSNSTATSVRESAEAEALGADACLVVVPYYNKPPQRGLLEHFKAVASSTELPIILYNVPSRTITNLEVETIKKLAEHPNIIGIKEASGNIEFDQQIRQACGQQFLLLSGDDASYDEFMKIGGDGIISVASHVIPNEMKQQKIRDNKDILDALFCEANPIPLKMALFLMKLIRSPELRLPLVALERENAAGISKLLKRKGLIE